MNITDQKLFIGDIWSWTESLSSYPASQYTLKLIIKQGSSGAGTEITASGNGDDYEFTVSTAVTSTFIAGEANYSIVVSKDKSVKKTINSGVIYLHPNLAAEGDQRSYWEKIYDHAQTAYISLIQKKISEVSINGRTIKYKDREELIGIMNHAKNKINSEKRIRKNKIKTRFI